MSRSTGSRFRLLAGGLLAGGMALAVAAPAAPGLDTNGLRMQAPVRCDGAIQHPLAVKASALDPVRRGETIRVRVTTTSRHDLERGEVKLVSTGGATLLGASRVPFGRLAAGRAAASEFAVRLPSEGGRFLLQFRVTGEGETGLSARGATLNLLPDGPADPGRVVTSDSGERIVEHRARRIGR